MALWDTVKTWMTIGAEFEPVQARVIEDMDMGSSTLEDLLLRVQGVRSRPWTAASIREALGVPAIFGAVNLISNLVGSMTMEALRNEVKLRPSERPRIIVRPDPFTIPREFYRSTAYNLATRGETWWWIAMRDDDGNAMSVINVNPAEVTVAEDRDDLRYPIIKWRDKTMRNADFKQLVYSREPGSLRGHGPLQMCGAAISVSVESQEWAANYYAGGGIPQIMVKVAPALGGDPDDPDGTSEAAALLAQWMDKDSNTPRIIDTGIESVTQMDQNSQGAAMLESRGFQNVEVATMFNMDATILNAAVEGSSLTYQNVGTKFEDLLRQCLRPNYLEVIEQSMSDLLTRSTVARFNTEALTLADIQTRYNVYATGIDKGIIDSEEARSFEGLAPGDVENAAVPFSPPQAVPASLPVQARASEPVRCDGKRMLKGVLRPCNKLLSEDGAFTGRCPRCDKRHDIRPIVAVRVAAPVEVPGQVGHVGPAPVVPVVPEPDRGPEPAPQVIVNPAIHIPAQPVTMNVQMPHVEEQAAELHGQVTSLSGYMADLAGHVARLSTDQATLSARVEGVAESQSWMADKMNEPPERPKPKTVVPIRDGSGRIVAATIEEAS
jgi:HK97 family phage portal protein